VLEKLKQTTFTSIEPKHSTASVHNKSGSANLKRVTDTSTTTNNGSNVIKSNKPTMNQSSCKFSLTIFMIMVAHSGFKKIHLKVLIQLYFDQSKAY
jgi:uncharacterized membrane protein